MPLASGTRLGPYEIERSIGAGGMGEVYRARDTRLDRIIAIKVLPSHLAQDPQFLERFEREAKSISALNHPNICTLYDVGESDGVRYLVLEYLEGETLAARIAKGPLPLGDALKIAVEIASALDKAHRQRIVHRDLKPGNVMLTKTGSKLLDFGLAGFSQPKSASAVAGVANSEMPTVTAALTARGTILGTFQYMAPEQIEGEPADARSDLFAFGTVLYEMLTGKRAFEGKSHAGLLSAIIRDEPPPVSQVQPLTPAALDLVIRTCLVKSPDERYQSAHDLLMNLRWIGEGGTNSPAKVTNLPRKNMAAWLAAGIAFALLASALTWWLKPAPPVTQTVTRFRYPLPDGQNFTRPGRHTLALSPDGSKLAYVANQQLYLRAMDQLEGQPIRGTNEDPLEPVFSPDGQWLAYFVPAEGAGASGGTPYFLKKIAVAGGSPVTLSQLPGIPYGATWNRTGTGGTIAFGINTGSLASIQAIPESGGTPQIIVSGDAKKERLSQPQFVGDRHVLFVSVPLVKYTDNEGQIVVQTMNGDGKDRRTLVTGGTDARVLPTGQLVYLHDGTLLAVPFESNGATVTGGPVPVVEGVTETLAGQFAVASDGTFAFRPGTFTGVLRTLVWVDREGHEQLIPAKPRTYEYPRLSHDGTKISVGSQDEEYDIWVFDLAKETLTRLTFGAAFELYAAWTPDSKYLLYGSAASGLQATPADIFRKAADGTGAAEALTQREEGGYPLSVSPDGKSLIFKRYTPNASLFLLPLDAKGEARALFSDPKFNETNGDISPDGRWIAYQSNESGHDEVYVRPFPAIDGGRWQISSEGGTKPLWSRNGRELFFLTPTNWLAVVSVPVGPVFTSGRPQTLFDATVYSVGAGIGRKFDIAPDGKRFLMVRPVNNGNAAEHPSIVIVSHWFDEVKARMTTQR